MKTTQKGYKIYRADAKFRKGVVILISKRLKCDSYKTIEYEDGRFLQIKLKNEQELFGGDVNNLISVLKIETNVFQIQNLGEQIDKINVTKNIRSPNFNI